MCDGEKLSKQKKHIDSHLGEKDWRLAMVAG
jgi:hypothetical protein